MLVCLAVWLANSSRDAAGKILGIYLPIMAFTAIGLEHCIANMWVPGWAAGPVQRTRTVKNCQSELGALQASRLAQSAVKLETLTTQCTPVRCCALLQVHCPHGNGPGGLQGAGCRVCSSSSSRLRLARAAATAAADHRRQRQCLQPQRSLRRAPHSSGGSPAHWHLLPRAFVCLQGADVTVGQWISHNLIPATIGGCSPPAPASASAASAAAAQRGCGPLETVGRRAIQEPASACACCRPPTIHTHTRSVRPLAPHPRWVQATGSAVR